MAKQQGRKPGAQGGGSQPITRHPLFPAIVALWFGALFGLGSLAIRPALLEAVVLKFHLDLIVPAAAPPLGVTARILFAMAMAVLGAGLGVLVSRSLTRPRAAPRKRKRNAASAAAAREEVRRYAAYVNADPDPYGLLDQDADEDADMAGERPVGRRRSLAIDEDYGPVYHHEMAPLPGGAPQILDVTNFEFVQAQDAAEAAAAAAAPAGALDLSSFLSGDAPEAAPQADEKDPPMLDHFAPPSAAGASAAPRGFDGPGQAGFGQPAPALAPAQPAFTQAEAIAPAPVAPAPQGFPVLPQAPLAGEPFFAPPPAYVPPLGVAPAQAPQAHPAAGLEAAALPTAGFVAPTGEVAERIAAAALEMLSQAELIERLALSLQRRRAPVAAPAVPEAAVAPPAAPVPQAYEAPVPGSPLSEAASVLPPMPAAMRPVGFDFADHDDDEAAAHLPPRHFAMPESPADAPAAETASQPEDMTFAAAEDEDDLLADGYSSLLGLSRPGPRPEMGRPEFVRIDEGEVAAPAIEPVVVFPGQAQRAAAHLGMPPAPSVPVAPFASAAAPGVGADPARRFDGPVAAPAAEPASYAPPSAHDREEAERALRTALSTLQRMSATG